MVLNVSNTQRNLRTFGEVYKSWLTGYVDSVKPSTANKTQEWFNNHILTEFEDSIISEITPADCQIAMNKWAQQLVRYKTIGNYASQTFHYAVVIGLRPDDPMKQIIIPKKGKTSTRDSKK